MRTLFYFGELRNTSDFIDINARITTKFSSAIPVISFDNDINLYFLLDVPKEITRIKWRKFKVPRCNKYKNTILFKYRKRKQGTTAICSKSDFTIIEDHDPEIWINYCVMSIIMPFKIPEEERKLIVGLAQKEFSFYHLPIKDNKMLIL